MLETVKANNQLNVPTADVVTFFTSYEKTSLRIIQGIGPRPIEKATAYKDKDTNGTNPKVLTSIFSIIKNHPRKNKQIAIKIVDIQRSIFLPALSTMRVANKVDTTFIVPTINDDASDEIFTFAI